MPADYQTFLDKRRAYTHLAQLCEKRERLAHELWKLRQEELRLLEEVRQAEEEFAVWEEELQALHAR